MSKRRLIKRRVDEEGAIEYTINKSREKGEAVIHCRHGGSVSNSYGHRADTEAVVTVAWPDGRYWQSTVERLPANKVTLAGAFRACTGTGILFDRRYSDEHRQAARAEFLAWAEQAAERELVTT